jgi:hypothetical protein
MDNKDLITNKRRGRDKISDMSNKTFIVTDGDRKKLSPSLPAKKTV